MHRFYLPPDQCSRPILTLGGREAHHALHVLRLRIGDRVTILDGAGTEFFCQVGAHDRDKVQLEVVEKRFAPPLPCRLTLLQALPKGKLFESIVQKATELGAFRIVPLLSERVVTRLDGEDATVKRDKWRQATVEAVKQCGTPWLPEVAAPMSLSEFLARGEQFDLPLLGSLQPGSKHPRELIQAFAARHGSLPKSACIWVGPEGDFTPAELAQIQSAGALPITLGRFVLRADTAAIYSLSILNYELQGQTPG